MKELWKRITRAGLTRQTLLWFLFISLVPLCIVSWLSYQEAHNHFHSDARRSLHNLLVVQSQSINAAFERVVVDLIQESDRQSNSRFLGALTEAFKKSKKSASEFVESYQWATLIDQLAWDLTAFGKEHGYYDIYMIDFHGNILFTTARKKDLGQNLFKGSLAGTRFARSAGKALESGKILFSDLELYPPKANLLSGFMVSPIIDEQGEKRGLMALHMAGDKLSRLLALKHASDARGSRYIIGSDLTLRSPNALGKGYPVLRRSVKTDLTRKWHQEHMQKNRNLNIHQEEVTLYAGPHGKEVLGLHIDMDIPGVRWAYIAEIDADEALSASRNLARITLLLIAVTVLVVMLFTLLRTRRIVQPIVAISRALSRVGQGELQQQISIKADHELANLVEGFNSMMANLRDSAEEAKAQQWLQEGVNQLNEQMQGDQDLAQLARNTIGFMCRHLGAFTGACYVVKDKKIHLMGSYAFSSRKGFRNEFSLGEGIVGQAALEAQPLEITDLPQDYLAVSSGLGESLPRHITVIPLIWNEKVTVLLELGTFKPFDLLQTKFMKMASPAIAVATQTALARTRTMELLEKTQAQAEELQAREEELRDSNRILEQQARDLKRSEEILRQSQVDLEEKNELLNAQQEELRVANEELEEQAQDLKSSRNQVEIKNRELEKVQGKLKQRAEELTVSSKYKSEFLANMSHELRTPLNSLLILAKLLSENREGNLTEKQVEFSTTIHDSGSELLNLINEILDLSKIEAGRMEINIESVRLKDFISDLKRRFNLLAEQKGLEFRVEATDIPEQLTSDSQKLGQVVQNLLSNAFKFTARGEILMRIAPPPADAPLSVPGLRPENALTISVTDSGIGIPRDRLNTIFEAFQQVDGTTSRKYGGTGLGLTISRELARLLGGELQLKSREGVGSTFTLYIPRELKTVGPAEGKAHASKASHLQIRNKKSYPDGPSPDSPEGADHDLETGPAPLPDNGYKPSFEDDPDLGQKQAHVQEGKGGGGTIAGDKKNVAAQEGGINIAAQESREQNIPDDRLDITPEDRSILIIEDDPRFAEILAQLSRDRGFKVLVAEDGETGLHLADYYLPSGIILDIGLPGKDGWQVMAQLKDTSRTRHIPVHFMSASDFSVDAMKKGAIGFLTKPVSMEEMQQALVRMEDVIDRPMKRLLIVEDNSAQLKAVQELIGNNNVRTMTASTGAEAQKILLQEEFDCIILDYALPDMNSLELLESFQDREKLRRIPLIIYTGKELEPRERALLENYAQSLIIKSVHSQERLLDDTTLFLHRIESSLPEEQQRIIRMLHDRESIFNSRKILLIDDDVRNLFALSAILQEKNMKVIVARNGIEALDKLEKEPDVAIVLMDIMMPEMDGYEATRQIRSQERFSQLPIIALTAKAMKGDRKKCIDSGASDYLAKPVDTDKLISMIRVWLYQK